MCVRKGEHEWGNAERVQNSKSLVPHGDLGLGRGRFEETSVTQVGLRAGLVDSRRCPPAVCKGRIGERREGQEGAPFPLLLEPDQEGEEAERCSLALWISTSRLGLVELPRVFCLGVPFPAYLKTTLFVTSY